MTDNQASLEEFQKGFQESVENSFFINLCTGTREDGSDFFAYIKMGMEDYAKFALAVEKGEVVDFTDFGEILEYGEGFTPPPDIQKKMEEEYAVDHEFEEKFKTALDKELKEYSKLKDSGMSDEEYIKQKTADIMDAMQSEGGE